MTAPPNCRHESCSKVLAEAGKMGTAIFSEALDLYRKQCHLRRPIRDRSGCGRFREIPVIVREVFNLERHVYLVKFSDGATTFVFADEVDIA